MGLITSLFANVFRLAEMELDDDRENVENWSGTLFPV